MQRLSVIPSKEESPRTGGSFYEFFAGGGMAHAGLGAHWRCLFANDFDAAKARSYADNWGGEAMRVGDVNTLTSADLAGRADLAWASFPCQDVSLAGSGKGIGSDEERTRSGAFWGFRSILEGLRAEGRSPPVVILENVAGLASRRGGKDLETVAAELVALGYEVGAVEVDSVHFVPQSRPRIFVVAARKGEIAAALRADGPQAPWHPGYLTRAVAGFRSDVRESWVWWRLGAAPRRSSSLVDILEPADAVQWFPQKKALATLAKMTPIHRERVERARLSDAVSVGGLFMRTRTLDGVKAVRAEVRFDGVAGCLRTAAGGSSRQRVVVAGKGEAGIRLLTPREAARLMGLPDEYRLPPGATNALNLVGDGVCAPVVSFLRDRLVDPLLGRGASIGLATKGLEKAAC